VTIGEKAMRFRDISTSSRTLESRCAKAPAPWRVAATRVAAVAAAATFPLSHGAVVHASIMASSDRDVTMYAVTTQAQFLNEADDVARGDATNPFDIDVKTLPPKPNGRGELPGNSAYFAFIVYSDPTLKTKIGSGSYACRYGFDQRAICDANFAIDGSSLTASGLVNFADSTFTLPVSGGTGAYLGARGEVVARRASHEAAKNETILKFILV
jgi:hypothetical protein